MTRFPIKLVALAASALALSLSAQAQTSTASTTSRAASSAAAAQSARTGSAKADLARADRRFIETAAMSGMAEVEMGKMAQQKASNAQVKEFAQRMVTDHTKSNSELMSMASSKGVQPPVALDRSHRNDTEKMGKSSGADFDREYMARQITDHRKSVGDFKKAADSAKDPELKAWAAKSLPTLEEHHKMALTLHDSVKGRAGAATSAPKP